LYNIALAAGILTIELFINIVEKRIICKYVTDKTLQNNNNGLETGVRTTSYNNYLCSVQYIYSLNEEVFDDPKSDVNSSVGINADHVSTYFYLIKLSIVKRQEKIILFLYLKYILNKGTCTGCFKFLRKLRKMQQ
jgi:hypothetical protein